VNTVAQGACNRYQAKTGKSAGEVVVTEAGIFCQRPLGSMPEAAFLEETNPRRNFHAQ
jgi:hypothetical protein